MFLSQGNLFSESNSFGLCDTSINLLKVYLNEFHQDLKETPYELQFYNMEHSKKLYSSNTTEDVAGQFDIKEFSENCTLFNKNFSICPEKYGFSMFRPERPVELKDKSIRHYAIWPKKVMLAFSDECVLQVQVVNQEGYLSNSYKKHCLDIRISLSGKYNTLFVAHFLIGDNKNIYNFDFLGDKCVNRKVKLGFCLDLKNELICEEESSYSYPLKEDVSWGNGFCFSPGSLNELHNKNIALSIERGKAIFSSSVKAMPSVFSKFSGSAISYSVNDLKLIQDSNDPLHFDLIHFSFFHSKTIGQLSFHQIGPWFVLRSFIGRDRFDGFQSIFQQGMPTYEFQYFESF